MFSYSKEILAAMNKVYFLLFHLLCFLSFSCKFFKQSFYLATHIIPPDLRNCKDKNARNLIFFHLIFSTPFLNFREFSRFDSIVQIRSFFVLFFTKKKKEKGKERSNILLIKCKFQKLLKNKVS